jgi:metal-dependent amidase/aminoacylase/carboxypeptidase family protein
VTDVQTVVSREKNPSEFGVVSVGAIQAGTAGNIIPDSALLRGTIRSYDPKTRDILINGVRRTARAVGEMAGAPEPSISLDPARGTPAVVSDSKLVDRIVPTLKAQLGDDKVFEIPRVAASEDFSEFAAEGVPIMFFYIGVYDPKDVAEANKPGGKPMPANHSPFFAPVPGPSITTGVRAMTSAVLSSLGAKD